MTGAKPPDWLDYLDQASEAITKARNAAHDDPYKQYEKRQDFMEEASFLLTKAKQSLRVHPEVNS